MWQWNDFLGDGRKRMPYLLPWMMDLVGFSLPLVISVWLLSVLLLLLPETPGLPSSNWVPISWQGISGLVNVYWITFTFPLCCTQVQEATRRSLFLKRCKGEFQGRAHTVYLKNWSPVWSLLSFSNPFFRTKVNFLSWKLYHVALLIKTYSWLFITLRIRSKLICHII